MEDSATVFPTNNRHIRTPETSYIKVQTNGLYQGSVCPEQCTKHRRSLSMVSQLLSSPSALVSDQWAQEQGNQKQRVAGSYSISHEEVVEVAM